MTGMNVVGDLFGSGKMFCHSEISTRMKKSSGVFIALTEAVKRAIREGMKKTYGKP
jgi:cobalamin-dependent methionine synthase I